MRGEIEKTGFSAPSAMGREDLNSALAGSDPWPGSVVFTFCLHQAVLGIFRNTSFPLTCSEEVDFSILQVLVSVNVINTLELLYGFSYLAAAKAEWEKEKDLGITLLWLILDT